VQLYQVELHYIAPRRYLVVGSEPRTPVLQMQSNRSSTIRQSLFRIATRVAAILWPLCAIWIQVVAVPSALANDKPVVVRKIKIVGLHVSVWIPHRDTPGPWPIIIFSHGFYGCDTQVSFLMRALAGVGYAVFAPAHRDLDCGNVDYWSQHSEVSFATAGRWTDTTYFDRDQDIEKLLDALSKNRRYCGPKFDWKHVGLVGHSLGGYTVLGIAGAWPRWKDPRVKAVLALSPYALPFMEAKTLGNLGVPVMYQGGTRDWMTPFLKMNGGVYDQTSVPKYFVEFKSIGHRGWTDDYPRRHDEIVEYGEAFLDRYLKGKPIPATLFKSHPDIADLKYQE
jgi:predicted dienelactone hydrolase